MNTLCNALAAILIIGLLFLTASCARQHYIKSEDGSLSFYYTDGTAEEILFVSSLDRFQPRPARKVGRDVWRVTVPLAAEFEYFYLVNGTPTLPDCPYTVQDDFGGKNCLYVHGL
ncbi:MAG: hypothetical protein WC952_02795 [Desulfobulbaceae bacterium]